MSEDKKHEMIVYVAPSDEIEKIKLLIKRHVGLAPTYEGKPVELKSR